MNRIARRTLLVFAIALLLATTAILTDEESAVLSQRVGTPGQEADRIRLGRALP